ncbi:helix-turn-helix transcriptional regulator [Leucobacter sp. M11]|uniref:helix-turn-helix transcriptional regulator n=1 Tax=Leucobacter sp. M11 TaxID=2993565 RepID=UPI002D80D1FC|nr:AraC family transcriptional regulator [Leucobacter sp. M11]MEB4613151.1 AraC family transcriptional regulator [Leucobacter sp. M11]
MSGPPEPDADEAFDASGHIILPPVTIPPRVHPDEHLILWQVRGRADFRLDGAEHSLTAGRALWVPAGVVHEFRVHENSVLLPVLFPAPFTATTLLVPTRVPVDRELRILLLAKLQSQISIIRPAANLNRQILALIEVRPAHSSALRMPVSRPALAVAETLRFNPGDDRTLVELAASAHASARTIQRAFQAETGASFQQWRLQNRMETAALLLRSAPSLAGVANRVGYLNPSAFGRAFRAHFGMTPSAYAQRFHRER